MFVSRLKIKNWKNFQMLDIPLRERQFIIGPNASGKSNLLDAFRFLRDVASTRGGGLQQAVRIRHGIPKLRNLAARRDPEVAIEVELATELDQAHPDWRYALAIRQEARGRRLPYVSRETVWKASEMIFNRPDAADKRDHERTTQTFLEQINSNQEFRELAQFLGNTTYLHIVPQLVRHADSIQGRLLENDPYGQTFLERIADTPVRTRRARLRRIEDVLKLAVPQLEQLEFVRHESTGRPHLEAIYSHWRPHAGRQREDQFSDGTLRLIALLWSLQEGDSLLLLEEPELSLNEGIVAQLAPLLHSMQRVRRRQVLVSTHSEALLRDEGIDGREVLILLPDKEGTMVKVVSDLEGVRPLLDAGLPVADAVLRRTDPREVHLLSRT